MAKFNRVQKTGDEENIDPKIKERREADRLAQNGGKHSGKMIRRLISASHDTTAPVGKSIGHCLNHGPNSTKKSKSRFPSTAALVASLKKGINHPHTQEILLGADHGRATLDIFMEMNDSNGGSLRVKFNPRDNRNGGLHITTAYPAATSNLLPDVETRLEENLEAFRVTYRFDANGDLLEKEIEEKNGVLDEFFNAAANAKQDYDTRYAEVSARVNREIIKYVRSNISLDASLKLSDQQILAHFHFLRIAMTSLFLDISAELATECQLRVASEDTWFSNRLITLEAGVADPRDLIHSIMQSGTPNWNDLSTRTTTTAQEYDLGAGGSNATSTSGVVHTPPASPPASPDTTRDELPSRPQSARGPASPSGFAFVPPLETSKTVDDIRELEYRPIIAAGA